MKQPIVSRSADVMGGTAVFHGTRVPVQTLLDYLEAGESINDFLENRPANGLDGHREWSLTHSRLAAVRRVCDSRSKSVLPAETGGLLRRCHCASGEDEPAHRSQAFDSTPLERARVGAARCRCVRRGGLSSRTQTLYAECLAHSGRFFRYALSLARILATRSGAKPISSRPRLALATSRYSAILPSRKFMIDTPSKPTRLP